MEQYDIYKDIAERTDGNIYIGVIGGVRTGKSTFIKRFMDLVVLKNIEDEYTRVRTKDELPQSASGKTIMTTEPKFIPNEPVKITVGDNISLNVRMIDCVGYLVKGAEGHMDGDEPRMVNTPWSSEPMPFEKAAELGTQKVINDHSTIGIVVTTDGSITDIPIENYKDAEIRVIGELKTLNKPFIVLLNSTHPYSAETTQLKQKMEEEYEVAVLPVNCAQLKEDDIKEILENVLLQFPVMEVCFNLPNWLDTLEFDHYIKKDLSNAFKAMMKNINKIDDVKKAVELLEDSPFIRKAYIDEISLGNGSAVAEIAMEDGLFYKVLSETLNIPLENDYQLISVIKELSGVREGYEKMKLAMADAQRKGYGIVVPQFSDIVLDEPELYRQGSRYGIRLKAKGRSMHLIKADIEAEVNPIIGSEEQTISYIEELKKEYKENPQKIWELNLFGRSLESLVTEGMNNKLYRMPQDAQFKLQETLEKIINEGSGGLICILL